MPAKRTVSQTTLLVVLIILTIIWMLPLIITFNTALKSVPDAASSWPWDPPERIVLLDNIKFAWETGKLNQSFTRSVIYAGFGATFAIILASLASYSLASLRIPRAFWWFLLIYSGTIFPFQMYLLPLFYMFQATSLYDTQIGLLTFYTAIAIPFCLFVLRNHFTTISPEIVEAAKMDGLSNFGIYRKIMMPLSVAPIAALFLFQFTWIWNELLFGITLARSADVRPVMAGLAGLRGIYASQNTPGVLAGALLASIPTILIFLLLGRYLLQGMTLTTSGE
ncbi:MAG: carbohydrate ABC transporter permease [Chloroflexi bacterium]|nr:MAG: carbohydrate ABC transporter permease [Chloroflexota bacterium]